MNWSDLEYVWKRQAPPAGASADVDVLRRNFEASHRKTAAALAVRDYSEAAAGLLSSAVFAYTWWRLGRDGWPFAITIALILGVSAVFCRERIRSHRRRVGPAVSLLAKLDADIAELRHQRRRGHQRQATQRLQRLHDRRQRPVRQRGFDVGFEAVPPCRRRLDGRDTIFQHDVMRGVLER